MIVLLDSTALVSDPLLQSTAWKILVHAVRTQGVRVGVTEIIRREAIAGYRRRLDEADVAIDRWNSRHAAVLGLLDLGDELRRALADRADRYEQTLRDLLAAAGVEVIEIPAVDHAVLIDRAVRRVPPCDNKGDGYRDTLNWFAIRELVQASPDCSLVWVSQDSGDFTAGDSDTLHPELVAELDDLGAAARVTIKPTLQDAGLYVASTFTDSEGGLAAIQRRLVARELASYVQTKLLDEPTEIPVSAAGLALPLGAEAPVLALLDPIGQPQVDVKASLDGQQAAVQVTISCTATIVFELGGSGDMGAGLTLVSEDGETRIVETTKPLEVEALVTVDEFDRPVSAELNSVRAPADDPGHLPWARAARRRLAEAIFPGDHLREALRNLQPPDTSRLVREALENLQALPADRQDADGQDPDGQDADGQDPDDPTGDDPRGEGREG